MPEIIHAAPNTATYPDDPNASLDQIKAWIRGAAAGAALKKQNETYSLYVNGGFNDWLISYNAGRAQEPPPQPPAGSDALLNDAGTDFDLVPASALCGPVPPYPKIVVTPSGKLSTPVSGILIGAVGAQVTQKDGTVWQRVS